MNKADEFLRWCNTHSSVVPNLSVINLAREAVYELKRDSLLLTEDAEKAWDSVTGLTARVEELERQNGALRVSYEGLRRCGNCAKLYEYYFQESHSTAPGSTWLACRDMDGYRTSVTPADYCHFEPSQWEVAE